MPAKNKIDKAMSKINESKPRMTSLICIFTTDSGGIEWIVSDKLRAQDAVYILEKVHLTLLES